MPMPNEILGLLKRRLPAKNETFLVLSTAAFLIFTWSLRTLFFNIPAFFLSYTIDEILVIAAYMLAFALCETLRATLLLIIASILLPGGLFKEGFSYKASFFLIAFGVVSIHMQNVMTNQPTIDFLLLELGRAFALWLALVLLTRYVNLARKIALDILDRLTIFSYIYLPLGLVSLLVVTFRLLW